MDENTGISDSAILKVTFTLEEFELLDRARGAAGYESHPDFYRDAIMAYVQSITERRAAHYDSPVPTTGFYLNEPKPKPS